MAETLPYSSLSMSTSPMSYTLMTPGSNTASPTFLTARTLTCPGQTTLTASSMTAASPMIRGSHISRTFGSVSALTEISGPMLAGSPMVMPMIGFFMIYLLFVFPFFVVFKLYTNISFFTIAFYRRSVNI